MTTSAEYEQQFPVSPDAQRRSDHRDSILRPKRLRQRGEALLKMVICRISETPAYRTPPGWQRRDRGSAGSLSLSSSLLFPKSACQGDGTVIRIHLRPLFVLSAWSDAGSPRERSPGTDFMPSRSLYVPGISFPHTSRILPLSGMASNERRHISAIKAPWKRPLPSRLTMHFP